MLLNYELDTDIRIMICVSYYIRNMSKIACSIISRNAFVMSLLTNDRNEKYTSAWQLIIITLLVIILSIIIYSEYPFICTYYYIIRLMEIGKKGFVYSGNARRIELWMNIITSRDRCRTALDYDADNCEIMSTQIITR